mmetsp:Transcript_63/g.188  ORF Transcript_63/g.188 Transcript_63/m.188 type:complete len:256 (-) Transcript_63:340-1107(-)
MGAISRNVTSELFPYTVRYRVRAQHTEPNEVQYIQLEKMPITVVCDSIKCIRPRPEPAYFSAFPADGSTTVYWPFDSFLNLKFFFENDMLVMILLLEPSTSFLFILLMYSGAISSTVATPPFFAIISAIRLAFCGSSPAEGVVFAAGSEDAESSLLFGVDFEGWVARIFLEGAAAWVFLEDVLLEEVLLEDVFLDEVFLTMVFLRVLAFLYVFSGALACFSGVLRTGAFSGFAGGSGGGGGGAAAFSSDATFASL